jgi:hypothetical protein
MLSRQYALVFYRIHDLGVRKRFNAKAQRCKTQSFIVSFSFRADRYPQVEQNPFKNQLKGIKCKGAKFIVFPLRLRIFAPLR